MAARLTVHFPVDPSRDAKLDRAFELLRDLVDWSAADQRFPTRGNAVDTTGVVLWMLVSQRMAPERSWESAVKRLLDTQPDFLPRNKRLTEKTLSKAAGGYSRARSRLQRDAAKWFAERLGGAGKPRSCTLKRQMSRATGGGFEPPVALKSTGERSPSPVAPARLHSSLGYVSPIEFERQQPVQK